MAPSWVPGARKRSSIVLALELCVQEAAEETSNFDAREGRRLVGDVGSAAFHPPDSNKNWIYLCKLKVNLGATCEASAIGCGADCALKIWAFLSMKLFRSRRRALIQSSSPLVTELEVKGNDWNQINHIRLCI